MKSAIGYLRVSTREQGRSGLGLEGQRRAIEAFGAHDGFSIDRWHQDIQTGAGRDAILMRPGLATALKEAKAARCPLIVSRLDRLSRNVHFITGLMEHKVHFIVAAFGRDCDEFTLHIYASIAQQERKMISERIKAAKAVARARGQKFGLALYPKKWRMHVTALGRAALARAAQERAEAYRLHIEWAFRQPNPYWPEEPISYSGAAKVLNDRNIESPMGRRWKGGTILDMGRRLGLEHPSGNTPNEVKQARARAIWKEHPELTVAQARALARLDHPIGKDMSYKLWKACRKAAANRYSLYRRIGWKIDCRTHTRIRISKILKRHPAFTPAEVVEELGPGPFRKHHWVRQVMEECRRGRAFRRKVDRF